MGNLRSHAVPMLVIPAIFHRIRTPLTLLLHNIENIHRREVVSPFSIIAHNYSPVGKPISHRVALSVNMVDANLLQIFHDKKVI